MSSLGSLVVSLAANTAQFSSDLGKAAHEAERQMAAIRKSAEKAGKAIGAAFVAGVGVASVLVKQSIDAADEMTKMAQKAGVSTEAFSTLAYAANLSGVEMGALQSSMSKLAGTMTDVVRGTNKDAVDAFRTLGIAVQDSSGKLKSGDVIMSEVAARFATMENGAGKTALAIKIFGRSGADLIPLLNSGVEGIKAMQDEARALGVELDGNAGAAAERFNDNLTRLNTVKQGFANQIMKAVLPSLESLTNRMIDSAKGADGLGKAATVAATGMKMLMTVGAIVVGVFKSLGESLGGLAATIVALFSGNFKDAFNIAKDTASDFVGNIKSTVGNVNAIWEEAASNAEANAPKTGTKLAAPMIQAAEKAKKAAKAIKTEAEKAAENVQRMLEALAVDADTIGKSEQELTMYKLAAAGASEEQQDLAKTLMGIIKVKKDDLELQAYANQVIEDSMTPLEKYNRELQRLADIRKIIGEDNYTKAVAKAQDEFEKLSKAGKDSIDDLKRSIEGWGKQFTDTFVDGIMKGKLSFKDLADSIIRDLLRIIVQKQITDKIIGSWATQDAKGTGILGAIGTIFGGGMALGGEAKGGTSYLVGERGPEIFTPATSGTVTPSGAGGVTLSPTYNIRIDGATDQAKNQQMIQSAVQRGNAELIEKLQRAGKI
jgi:hypothetical protein